MSEGTPLKWDALWIDKLMDEHPINDNGVFLIIPVSGIYNARQIISSALEGAYDLYPETWGDVVFPVLQSVTRLGLMDFRQVGCALQVRGEFGEWMTVYEPTPECVAVKLNQSGATVTNTYGTSDSRTITSQMESSTVTSGLNEIWGGCLELTEYIMDVSKIILDLAEAGSDALDAVSNMLKPSAQVKTEWVADDLVGTQKNWSSTGGGAKWDTSTYVRTYERSVVEPVKKINPARLLSIVGDLIDFGINLLRASLTENLQEAVAGKLFNILTCQPDGQRKWEGVILTKDILIEWSDTLSSGTPIELLLSVTIKADALAGEIDFLSLTDLGDAFRQYMIGTLQPRNTWIVLVDDCPEPEPTTPENIDIIWASFGQTPPEFSGRRSSDNVTYNPITRNPNQNWVQISSQLFIITEYQVPTRATINTAKFHINRGTGNSFAQQIWIKRSNGSRTMVANYSQGIGGAGGDRSLQWSNTTDLSDVVSIEFLHVAGFPSPQTRHTITFK